jgi:polyhydroxyalkanoic acid synthase PhaR subunit
MTRKKERSMSTESEKPQSLDPFEIWREARDTSLESWRSLRDSTLASWSKLMIEFVNSEAYSRATAQWLDAYLTVSQPFQQAVEKAMTQVLTGLNMPTRSDVISLATRLTNIEMRLDDLDAKLDDIQRSIRTLSASKDEIQQAIQTFSTVKGDIQSALQAFSTVKDALDASATAAARSNHATPQLASGGRTATMEQLHEEGVAPSQPVNHATTATTKRSGGKQGKAKEAH